MEMEWMKGDEPFEAAGVSMEFRSAIRTIPSQAQPSQYFELRFAFRRTGQGQIEWTPWLTFARQDFEAIQRSLHQTVEQIRREERGARQ